MTHDDAAKAPTTSTPPADPFRWRRRVALAVAIAADLLQIVVFPVFGEGFASPVNDALDVAVGLTLTALVGFHWAYVPGFLLELVPVGNAVPAWTGAVLLATRTRKA